MYSTATASSRRFGSAAIPNVVRSTIGLLSDSYALVQRLCTVILENVTFLFYITLRVFMMIVTLRRITKSMSFVNVSRLLSTNIRPPYTVSLSLTAETFLCHNNLCHYNTDFRSPLRNPVTVCSHQRQSTPHLI